MRVAVVHHLPTGGAMRVMAEWLARTKADEIRLYTRDARAHEFVEIPGHVEVVERPLRSGNRAVDEIERLRSSPRDGAKLAAEIDSCRYDAVFCFASMFTQAIDVLPFLRTPNVFYAPEPLRSAYEPQALVRPGSGLRESLTRRGLNPVERRRRALDRRYIRGARQIVTHSQFTRRTLREIYGVESEVVRLGVDSHTFKPSSVPRQQYVLSVGALHVLKGHDQAIEAVATIPEQSGLRPRLVVVGDRGEDANALDRLAAERSVELEVRSRLSLTEVVAAYQHASAVVCTQIREPFGLVALEAMACATPVVAVREGGLAETVQNEKNGLLCPRDPHALGKAIARLLSDPKLSQQLGAAGRKQAVKDWQWGQTAAGYDALLEATKNQ